MLEIVVLETARELLVVDHFVIGSYLRLYFDFNKLKQFTFLSFLGSLLPPTVPRHNCTMLGIRSIDDISKSINTTVVWIDYYS